MRKAKILILLMIILSACGGSNNKTQTYKIHDDVEVSDSGSVPIEDFIDNKPIEVPADNSHSNSNEREGNNFSEQVNPNYNNTAENREEELKNDPEYFRNNGNLKPRKIAKELNREGYRKSDGKKFRKKDIE